MIPKAKLKYYSSLRQKKYRDKEAKFIVEGKRLIKELLQSNFDIESVFLTNKFENNNPELVKTIKEKSLAVYILDDKDLNKITDTDSPQGIAATIKKKEKNSTEFEFPNKIVALDTVSDPGNVGTIIRNCDWFGIDLILISKGSADIYNPKTLRSTMGSFFHIAVNDNVDLSKKLENLKTKGYKIICADLKGKNVYKFTFPEKYVIVFSNEAHGPAEEIISIADKKITIPRFGNAESLNAASSSAVILSEQCKMKIDK